MSSVVTELRIRCGWCAADLGTKDGRGETGESTGICAGCLATEFGEPKLLPAWASPARVALPGLFRGWRDALETAGLLGLVWAVGALGLYLLAEIVAAAIPRLLQ